jgi:myotubularin-related protein 14
MMASASAPATLCPDDLRRLLQAFSAAQFRPKDCGKAAHLIQDICCQLIQRDTPDIIQIQNTAGELCTSYPLTLVIPTTGRNVNPVSSGEVDAAKLRDLMLKARVARCRARFPVPVILFDGKYVCRSATLSGGPEIYGRSGFDLLFPAANEEEDDPVSFSSLSLSDSSQICSKVRAQDINLLQQLGVGNICDLMVEKKKVKFGVYITSSEKADKESRYSAFRILSLPYPGCEFFRTYRDMGYAGEGLVFDWSQQFVDAVLDVPEPEVLPDVHWDEYRSWDIIKLTQNYLRLFIRCLITSDHSLLVHCISGWDRTPLFVSLLRLALWADGQIHQSLTALEITFLTLAYDWYLFGHNLNDRLQKGEEILFFCFYFLQVSFAAITSSGDVHDGFCCCQTVHVVGRVQHHCPAR